jgi:hypothetical protein
MSFDMRFGLKYNLKQEKMNLLKSNILPITGVAVLLFFILIAYINNSVLLDRLLLCSFILFGIFILKIRGNVSTHR